MGHTFQGVVSLWIGGDWVGSMESLTGLVVRARAGDIKAYGDLVWATQTKAYGVALGVLRDPGIAQDAVQQTYLRAFRRFGMLQEPAAFAGCHCRRGRSGDAEAPAAHPRQIAQGD